jgi:hypothetical protein
MLQVDTIVSLFNLYFTQEVYLAFSSTLTCKYISSPALYANEKANFKAELLFPTKNAQSSAYFLLFTENNKEIKCCSIVVFEVMLQFRRQILPWGRKKYIVSKYWYLATRRLHGIAIRSITSNLHHVNNLSSQKSNYFLNAVKYFTWSAWWKLHFRSLELIQPAYDIPDFSQRAAPLQYLHQSMLWIRIDSTRCSEKILLLILDNLTA